MDTIMWRVVVLQSLYTMNIENRDEKLGICFFIFVKYSKWKLDASEDTSFFFPVQGKQIFEKE